MGSHPINLTIRFLLELTALIAMGTWGWKQNDGWQQFALVVLVPIVAAAIWGTFAVPEDPSRSGNAPIPVHGMIRLVIELAFFAFAAWALNDFASTKLSLIFGIVVVLHYAVSYDRIMWLLTQ
jgi:predicted Na+-dependent transporter